MIATGHRILSFGGLRVDMLYYFGVVWLDGGHLSKGASRRQVTNPKILHFLKVLERFCNISAC